jgi:hypothetical protein
VAAVVAFSFGRTRATRAKLAADSNVGARVLSLPRVLLLGGKPSLGTY